MKRRPPTQSDRIRALWVLVGLVIVVMCLLYYPLLRPWWQVEVRLYALKQRLSEALALQAASAGIEANVSALRASALADGRYLPEPSIPLASAALTQRIQQAVEAGGTDDSVCVLGNRLAFDPDRKTLGCDAAGIRVAMQCGVVALEKVLRTLEQEQPRLHIDVMELGAAPNPLGFDRPPPPDQPLDVSFEVSACLFPDVLFSGDIGARG